MADMRKDRRAPASLKVKYKSATVDQFIDQFGTDVSLGGMFIKTKTPLEIGALLKLELQLSDASPVIQGNGRVCWRRMPSADPALPPGMGIKFLRLEDASRATVERMVSNRGGMPSRFDQTDGAEIADPSTPPPSPDVSVPVASKPAAPPAAPAAKPPAAPRPGPFAAGPAFGGGTAPALRGGASDGTAPALRGGASGPGPIASGKAPAPPRPPQFGVPSRAPGAKPQAPPFTSGAPKAIPSVRAGANSAASASSTSSASSSRIPVAGLFSDSQMSRATPEPAAQRSSRSSFFPAAPAVNGNAPPPAPAGVSSRPPPAPAPSARSLPIAGAFGAGPARIVPPTGPTTGPTRAEEEDAIDRMFEEVVQPRSVPPPGSRHQRTTPLTPPSDNAALDDVLGDAGTFPPRARPPAPHVEDELFADDAGATDSWSSSSSANTALRSPSLPRDGERARTDAETADFGEDEFGEAEIGGASSVPVPVSDDLSGALQIPSLSEPVRVPRRSSPLIWIGLAVAVLAAGGVIYMQRSRTPAPTTTPAAQAAPVANPAPAASAAGAAAPSAAPEATAGAAAPGAPADSPAAQAATAVPANPTPGTEAAPAAEPATVSVEVSSVPRGAEILIGGKSVGTTPMHVALPLGVEAQVSVRSPGFATMTQSVTVSSASDAQRFKLEPLPYAVIVTTDPPGAELSFEGHSATAPGPLELGHLDGSASISVAKSGYQRIARPLRLEEFFEQDGVMRAQVEVRLSPLPGGGASSTHRTRSRGDAPPAPEAAPAPEGNAAPSAPGSTGAVIKVEEKPVPEAAAPAAPAVPTPPTPPDLPPAQ